MNREMKKRPFKPNLFWLIVIPVLGLAMGTAIAVILNLSQQAIGTLLINTTFLVAILVLLPFSGLNREELGLKIRHGQLTRHIVLSAIVFALYMLFYLFVIRISGLRPFTTELVWGLVAYAVTVFAEELYFRGMLFGFLEKRFSARVALLGTSLLFGLLHARQGISGIISRTITGWLWGSIRYASGMIFLLIFPIHFAFNSVWLLFEGNWSNPPGWASVALPVVEISLGVIFVIWHDCSNKAK